MPEASLALVVAVIVVAILFDISNGFNDSANAIATVVSILVLRPWQGVITVARNWLQLPRHNAQSSHQEDILCLR